MDRNKEKLLREQLVEYGKKLVECGLVQGTWGNLSVRLDEDYMLVTPSGLDYFRLTADDMVKVNIHTLKYEGGLKPTSEKGIHGGIYLKRPEIGGVIHTHSKYCSVFAASVKPVPIENEEAMAVFGTQVEIAEYALPGTEDLMKNTIEAFGENYGCIMANHGMACGGATLGDAFNRCRMLEEYCESFIESRWKAEAEI